MVKLTRKGQLTTKMVINGGKELLPSCKLLQTASVISVAAHYTLVGWTPLFRCLFLPTLLALC